MNSCSMSDHLLDTVAWRWSNMTERNQFLYSDLDLNLSQPPTKKRPYRKHKDTKPQFHLLETRLH